ncbi:tetratricopeptide repeat protein [filamentous cyanobacterium LEGE 07170]|nr:tetratricopeptide repeat protein [filamentous cyanobacterium LEGE 07170]
MRPYFSPQALLASLHQTNGTPPRRPRRWLNTSLALLVLPFLALIVPVSLVLGTPRPALPQTLTPEQNAALQEAEQLDQQAVQLYQQGRYNEAIPLAQQALELRETVLGETHPDVAISLNNLAELYRLQGNYAAAEPLYQRSLTILEAVLGETHPTVATSLNNLALLYQDQGNYAAAEPLYQRSLTIRETALGDTHPDVAISLNNLAELYRLQGNYAAAEPLYQRSLTILETVLGETHPTVATSLNNLALLYQDQGNYVAAEPLYQRALSIYETVLGDTHPDVAQSLNNLAVLYQSQGNYVAAEPLYQRALSIYETVLGDTHPGVAQSLNNLAVLYQDQGNYGAAEPLYQRALSIYETVLGDTHPGVAQSLNNLAGLYQDQGNYAAAEPLYQRSLTIRETVLGETHPDVATSLNNLAGLYQEQGNYVAAEPLYQRSLTILETVLGETHPNVATSLNNLAGLYQEQGNYREALPLFERAAESQETQLELTLTVTSEARRWAYLATLSGETNGLISLALQETAEAAPLALTTLLRRKGRVLDVTADSFATLRQQLTPENQALLDELQAIETQRANLVFGEPIEGQAEQLATLETRAEELQNTLARRSAEFRAETQPVTLEAVQQQIPADGALVELVRYQPFGAVGAPQERWGEPRYAAYVLFRDGTIRSVDLGDAAALDAQVFAFRDALRNPRSNIQPLARELDAMLMQPIRELTGEATHLLMSPDGALNLIPFSALMDESNTYLAERYTFTYLTSGRDLLRLQRETAPGQGPVLVANPDYGAIPPSPPYQGGNQAQRPPYQGGFRGISNQRSSDFGSLNTFAPLPGTEEEAAAIAPLLSNPLVLDGADATEEALKQVDRPSILHIATHGFFLQDQDCLAVPNTRSGREAFVDIISTDDVDCVPTPRNVENPLLRSGLVFAGVNQRDQFPDGSEDGVLTAQEVAQMNLRGTQLVVLSACETGLGNVVNGGGVYGLRRAFVLAGAESQLMSLWKVDDFGTSELMQGYYERITRGMGRSEALREVQRELLDTGAYQHPYYWAGFIFSGNWQPLEALE